MIIMNGDDKDKITFYTSIQEAERWVEYVAFSNNGTIVSLCCGLDVSIWHMTEMKRLALFPHKEIVWKCAFSAHDNFLYSAASDGCVYIWDLQALENVDIFKIHQDCVFGITVHPTKAIIATCSADNTINCFCCVDKTTTSTLKGHSKSVEDVCFSPCGNLLASCSKDKKILLWKNYLDESNLQAYSLTGHKNWIYMCRFSKDGKLLASASSDKRIGIWSIQRHCLLRFLQGHSNVIWGLTFLTNASGSCSPYLVSCSSDKTLRLWDLKAKPAEVECHRNLGNICDGTAQLLSCAFNQTTKHLAVSSYHGSVYIAKVKI